VSGIDVQAAGRRSVTRGSPRQGGRRTGARIERENQTTCSTSAMSVHMACAVRNFTTARASRIPINNLVGANDCVRWRTPHRSIWTCRPFSDSACQRAGSIELAGLRCRSCTYSCRTKVWHKFRARRDVTIRRVAIAQGNIAIKMSNPRSCRSQCIYLTARTVTLPVHR